jgi:hypothetical protein
VWGVGQLHGFSTVPKLLEARLPHDDGENRKIRRLAGLAMPRRPGGRHRRGPQSGAADPAGGEGALAAHPQLGHQHRPGVRP